MYLHARNQTDFLLGISPDPYITEQLPSVVSTVPAGKCRLFKELIIQLKIEREGK